MTAEEYALFEAMKNNLRFLMQRLNDLVQDGKLKDVRLEKMQRQINAHVNGENETVVIAYLEKIENGVGAIVEKQDSYQHSLSSAFNAAGGKIKEDMGRLKK